MKKSLFIAPFLGIALLAGSVPVIANAQAYYGNYSTYGTTQGCLDLTTFQTFGITDSQTAGQVSLLQEFLNQTGYLSGVSGTFDAGTLGAVINYQNAHDIQPTGTLTPQTIFAINSQSCENGYGNVSTGYIAPSYPVTNYSNGSNCYWSGTNNSTYVCRTAGTPVIYPVPTPIVPVVCNSNGYYGNRSYCNNGYGSVHLNSLSASYSYNTTTITLSGYGFSNSGNTVYFGNSIVSNGYSPNGTTLTFSVPTGYNTGTYSITVTNAQGGSSNALSFILNNSNYYNGNGYGNYNNCGSTYYYNGSTCYGNVAASLSSITGPTSVQPDVMNTWNISVENSDTAYVSLNANWGDGSSSVVNSQNSNTYGSSYSFSHEYITPGIYTVRVTATSSNGLTSYATYTVTVTNPNVYTGGYYYSRIINDWNNFR